MTDPGFGPLSLLDDIRIVAVEQYGAGPFGSMHLADLGADVIKVEDVGSGGDVGRTVPPYTSEDDSLFFQSFNRNKQSVGLDLRTEAGRRVFEKLVARSDAVYSNLRGDVPDQLGIRYSHLASINPRVVCVSLSAFGTTGPRASQPGYDYILQGLAGWMDLTGEPGSPPSKSGLSLVDYSGGFVAALGLLAGVHASRRTGRGMDLDLSLFDIAMSLLTYPATWHLSRGWKPDRLSRSAHPSLVPFQLFQGSDADWFVLGCAKEHFWSRAMEAIGRPDLLADPRYATFATRRDAKEALIRTLDETFATAPAGEWIRRLEEAGVPTGPVNDLDQAMADPQTSARGLIAGFDHEDLGVVKQIASPFLIDGARPGMRQAPARYEHTERVLKDTLELTDSEISVLAAEGAFGGDSRSG